MNVKETKKMTLNQNKPKLNNYPSSNMFYSWTFKVKKTPNMNFPYHIKPSNTNIDCLSGLNYFIDCLSGLN